MLWLSSIGLLSESSLRMGRITRSAPGANPPIMNQGSHRTGLQRVWSGPSRGKRCAERGAYQSQGSNAPQPTHNELWRPTLGELGVCCGARPEELRSPGLVAV
jgi:hypothetical protein